MAFDFLGTFNASQYYRFYTFARDQLNGIAGRLSHLNYEKLRIGSLTFVYDAAGNPTSFTASSSTTSYIGGLLAAYEVLGGQVKYDLQVRSLAQAVFILPGSESTPAQFLSNNEVMGGKGLADAPSANLIRKAREWMQQPIHYRREYIERKVRRAIDYVDQLDAEIALLGVIQSSETVKNSLSNINFAILALFQSQDYRAIYNDQGRDPYGKTVYAPFAPYSRTGATTEWTLANPASRDVGGYRYPGETDSASNGTEDGTLLTGESAVETV